MAKGESQQEEDSFLESLFDGLELPTEEEICERERKAREQGEENLALYTDLAESGNVVAQYEIAMFHLGQHRKWWPNRWGEKPPGDISLGIKWLKAAVQQDLPSAQASYGVLCLDGKLVPQDVQKGKQLLVHAAKAGDPDGQFQLGLSYEQGKGGPTNYSEAVKWYQKWIFSHDLFAVGPDKYLWGYQLDGTNATRVAKVDNSEMLAKAEAGDKQSQYHWAQRLKYIDGDNRTAAKWFRRSAEKGYAPAQYELAYLYQEGISWVESSEEPVKEEGDGVDAASTLLERQWLKITSEIDARVKYKRGELALPAREKEKEEALKWYARAAEQGWVRAQFALGIAYLDEEIAEKDTVQAVLWLGMAARNGHARAQLELADLLYLGLDTERDYPAAFKWYKAAAEQGVAEAHYKVGLMREYGEGVAEDSVAARQAYMDAALRLHPPAFFDMGRMLYRGKGGAADLNAARCWFTLMTLPSSYFFSDMNNLAAIYLGHIYEQGEGVKPDAAEADKWYSRYTNHTISAEFSRVGNLFRYGCPVFLHEDPDEALFWLKKAAVAGAQDAQYWLGDIYREGEIVSADKEAAAKWYYKAAEQGHQDSQFLLGLIYSSGDGVPENYAEARKWYERAAAQGHFGAQINLGVIYSRGRGVPEDYVEAYKWFIIAASQGVELAAKNRDAIRLRMTKEQIAAAQHKAASFKARKEACVPAETDSAIPIDEPPKSTGTGFLITEDGFLVTAGHIIKNAAHVAVATTQGILPAKVFYVDEANDIALLKIEGEFQAIRISSSSTIKMGDSVFTIGFPNIKMQGRNPKLTRGEVSSVTGARDDPRHFQISVPVQPGNSGGPLIDASGNVIGMVLARLSEITSIRVSGALPQNVNYALKSSFILALLEAYPPVAGRLLPPHGPPASDDTSVPAANEGVVMILVF